MPGMDGMAVLRTMKRRWPEGEVIVITGYPSVDTAKEAIRLGAFDDLVKPLVPSEVIEAASSATRGSIGRYAVTAKAPWGQRLERRRRTAAGQCELMERRNHET